MRLVGAGLFAWNVFVAVFATRPVRRRRELDGTRGVGNIGRGGCRWLAQWFAIVAVRGEVAARLDRLRGQGVGRNDSRVLDLDILRGGDLRGHDQFTNRRK